MGLSIRTCSSWGGNLRTREGVLPIPTLKIVGELSKQYDIEFVNAGDPIEVWLDEESNDSGSTGSGIQRQRRYDVLLVAQPSTLSPVELDHLIAAMQTGQPTLVFEDPLPNPENFRHMAWRGTMWPRFMNRGGTETCDIQKLWDALDLDIDHASRGPQSTPWLVWQLSSANPYNRDPVLNLPERIIVQELPGDPNPLFSKTHPATRGINELYFQYAGYLRTRPDASLEFEQLAITGKAGRINQMDFVRTAVERGGLYSSIADSILQKSRGSADAEYCLGIHVMGADAENARATDLPIAKSNTNVIYVCDVDLLADYFVDIRNDPVRNNIQYNFQNMAFVLNLVDSLVGEETYLDLRSRKIRHMTLREVEKTTEDAMQLVYNATQELETQRIQDEAALDALDIEETSSLEDEIKRLESKKLKDEGSVDVQTLISKQALLNNIKLRQQQRRNQKRQEFENKRREQMRSIELDAENNIREIQKKFKLFAVFIPPIPPLLVGLIVWTRRRLREREGISKARRLK